MYIYMAYIVMSGHRHQYLARHSSRVNRLKWAVAKYMDFQEELLKLLCPE